MEPLIQVSRAVGPVALSALAVRAGPDLVVVLRGGPGASPAEGEHVGCVCLGIPRPSLREGGSPSATVSTINVTGHEDGRIAEIFARRLAARTKGVCSVTCGIHLDDASERDIESIVGLAREMLEELEERLGVRVDE
jgi:gallate decarboxylase subunit D